MRRPRAPNASKHPCALPPPTAKGGKANQLHPTPTAHVAAHQPTTLTNNTARRCEMWFEMHCPNGPDAKIPSRNHVDINHHVHHCTKATPLAASSNHAAAWKPTTNARECSCCTLLSVRRVLGMERTQEFVCCAHNSMHEATHPPCSPGYSRAACSTRRRPRQTLVTFPTIWTTPMFNCTHFTHKTRINKCTEILPPHSPCDVVFLFDCT